MRLVTISRECTHGYDLVVLETLSDLRCDHVPFVVRRIPDVLGVRT